MQWLNDGMLWLFQRYAMAPLLERQWLIDWDLVAQFCGTRRLKYDHILVWSLKPMTTKNNLVIILMLKNMCKAVK